METFAFGDVDGDLDNDYDDFRRFKDDYIAMHGAAALRTVLDGFEPGPEPCGVTMLLIANTIVVSRARGRYR
jgi:hypothetical protein